VGAAVVGAAVVGAAVVGAAVVGAAVVGAAVVGAAVVGAAVVGATEWSRGGPPAIEVVVVTTRPPWDKLPSESCADFVWNVRRPTSPAAVPTRTMGERLTLNAVLSNSPAPQRENAGGHLPKFRAWTLRLHEVEPRPWKT